MNQQHFKHPRLIFAGVVPFIIMIMIVMLVTYEIQNGPM